MSTAFQPDAFQHNAFQIDEVVIVYPSGGFGPVSLPELTLRFDLPRDDEEMLLMFAHFYVTKLLH